jgi:hypothetical protein
MSISEKLNRLNRMAESFYRDADDAVAVRAFVEASNRAAVVKKFKRGKGHVPILIRKAMLQRLLMTVARLHDRRTADRDCLDHAFHLLEGADVRAKLAGNRRVVPAARKRWRKLRDDARVKRLRDLRDRAAAHSIPIPYDHPVSVDLMSVLSDTINIVERLGVATGVIEVPLRYPAVIWRDRVTLFWASVKPQTAPRKARQARSK